VLAQLRKEPNAILFIDEIHTIIGAGAASGGVMDASNLIKPMLASGELRCIGSTTYQEYRGIFEKDRALARRFQKIDVVEPSVEETYKILKGLKSRFEEHHECKYTDKALRARRSCRPLHQRPPPAGQGHRRHRRGRRQPSAAAAVEARRPSASVTEVEAIIAKIARIPPKTVSTSDKDVLRNWSAT
jgi:ATP-dependent Clp protease ATP-binding subunit ClpA